MQFPAFECSEFGTEFTFPLFLPLLKLMFAVMPRVPTQQSDGEVFIVHGRKGWQWIASVLAYLDWRAGEAWRPVAHRFHPDKEYYVRGTRAVLQAWHAPEPTQRAEVIPFRNARPARRRAA